MTDAFPATADPYPIRTTCAFPDCRTSVEEHHRVNIGLVRENGELRKRLGQTPAAATLNLDEVPAADLLAALARRIPQETR